MRITIITDSFPPVVNGVSTVTSWLAVNLVKHYNYNVTVITAGKKSIFNFLNKKLTVIRVPSYPETAYKIPLIGLDNAFRKILTGAISESDLIHAHNIHGIFTSFLVKLFNLNNFIFQPHYGGKFFRTLSNALSNAYRSVARMVSRLSSGHIFVSAYEKVTYSHYLGFPINGVIIPNPIPQDTKMYSWNPPDVLTITYAGRLDFYKHPEILLYIANKISKKYNIQVRVKFIGDGPVRQLLKNKIKKLTNINVKLLGRLPRHNYLREIASSTVLILPSEGEAYGIVVGEALSMGVPVIVTRPWGLIWKHSCPDRVRLVKSYNDIKGLTESTLAIYQFNNLGNMRNCRIPGETEVLKRYVEYYDKIIS